MKLNIEIVFVTNIPVIMLISERMRSMKPHSVLKYTRTNQHFSVRDKMRVLLLILDNYSSYLKTNASTACSLT